ncbi:hypothetical protein [Streptomyces sp. NPDC059894]|uniref:hypothetical protein n=1 Tax=unclassified Streptomyces TaxID=2593676 RepID=UPI00365510B5
MESARFLTTISQGIHVMGRARADRAFLESAVTRALKALDWNTRPQSNRLDG